MNETGRKIKVIVCYYPIINGKTYVKGKRIYRMVNYAREMVRNNDVR